MNLPNKLSLARICLIPLFVVAYFLPYTWAVYVATSIFVLASITDFLDGYIARKYNMVTDLGKLLDPIADKVLVCAALFCVVATNPLGQGTQLVAFKTVVNFYQFGQIFLTVGAILIIARELIISVVRQVAAAKSIVLHANIYGKIKTVLQVIALPMIILLKAETFDFTSSIVRPGFFDYLWIAAVVFFFLSVVMTIVSGVIYLVQNIKVFVQND